MPDPKSQVDMFEDDRLEAVLGNMMMVDTSEEEEKAPEKQEDKKED